MAETMYNIVEKKAKTAEFKDLWARMDTDRDLYFLKAYEMLRPDDKVMKDVINVTFNDPSTYAVRAIATLGGARRQTIVKGREISETQSATIESFIDDLSVTIDEDLALRGILALDSFLNEQACVRGHITTRNTVYKVKDKEGKETGELKIKVLPCDTRFIVKERGNDGLNWESFVTRRSKSSITDEYGKEIGDKAAGTGLIDVLDIWSCEKEYVYIDKKLAKTQTNPYGYPPFTNAQAATGSMLADAEALRHRGESIFWMNRELFKELNRTASIFQTINVGSFAGAMQYESSLGTKAKKPQKPPWGIYSVTPVEKGGGYTPVPVNDIRTAARLFYAILYTRIQQGGLSAIDYGNLTFPLSAVAITRLTSARDQIYLPRLQSKGVFYRDYYKMLIRQLLQAGKEFQLGEEGYLNKYKPKDLEGNYQINFRFYTDDKEQQIANRSIAVTERGLISDHSIRRTTLALQDPEAEEELLAIEESERNDEVVFLYRRCSRLISAGRNIEAWILYYRLRDSIRKRKQMMQAPPGAEAGIKQAPRGNQEMPLLATGEHGGRVAPEVGEEEKAVRQTEREGEKTAQVGFEAKQEEIR